MKYMTYLLERADALEPLVPCTLEEVADLEQKIGYPLPRAYVEYLLIGGKKASNLFSGSDHRYGVLLALQKDAQGLLEEDNFCKRLTNLDFVFLFHQGYEFHFFRLDEGDDPPVYYYLDGSEDDNFEKFAHSFSRFIKDTVDQELRYMGRF